MVPAAAIVDARNLFHQAENVLGFGAYPSVQGVMNGLALYGFDVRAVHVGVALARERDREALSYSHNVNAAYAEQIEAHPCGVTLRGELHLKDGRAEEKMVDVACAVDLCRLAAHIHQGGSPYQALVVLSQDIDLQPAYGYAAELDVSVHIAASSTVQYRPEPHLLLTEVPLALMCRESLERDSDLDTSVVGHELRARLAHLLYDQADQELAWRSIRREARRGGILLQHESGVLGVAAEEVVGGFTKGKTVRLYADGVDFGAGGSKFPVARCVPAPGLSGTQLRVASVSRRRTAFQLEARLTDTDEVIRIATSLGGMLPGTNILVQEQPGESGFRYIGFLEKPSVKDRTGQPVDPSMPVVLQIKHVESGSSGHRHGPRWGTGSVAGPSRYRLRPTSALCRRKGGRNNLGSCSDCRHAHLVISPAIAGEDLNVRKAANGRLRTRTGPYVPQRVVWHTLYPHSSG